MILSNSQLATFCKAAVPYYDGFAQCFDMFQINTRNRICMFLAQTAHESGGYRYTREIWGPTAQQLKYEPPSTLATRLGNTQKGDGLKFRGMGFIQTTGRYNFTSIAKDLKIDCVNDPSILSRNPYVVISAGWFWNKNNLNSICDDGDFIRLTKKINGGLTGIEDRQVWLKKAYFAIPA